MTTRIVEARTVVAIALAFTALTLSSASALLVAGKTPKAQKGDHIDEFRGWEAGYPVRFQGCPPFDKACARRARVTQPI